jgi:DNA polymerase/3'-5' exonuclease PolX
MSDKVRYPRSDAMAVAKELCAALKPVTEKLVVAGSLRRRKPMVGDVEILFVPKMIEVKFDLFNTLKVSAADAYLEQMLKAAVLKKRLNAKGHSMWGEKNKLAVHVSSGIPVDLFTATEENWFNYAVCRTGGAQTNVRICEAAQARGWKWNPYGPGFTDHLGETRKVTSELDVFEFVGLKYLEPWER